MALEFRPPTDLVNAYLNAKQQNAENAQAQIGAGLNALSQYQLLKQQRNLEGVKAVSQAFESGGPGLAQNTVQYLKNIGIDLSGYNPSVTPAGAATGASLPSNAPAAPQSSALTLTSSPTSSPVSEHIQNSLAMGHPDFSGLAGQAQNYMGMGKYGRTQIENLKSQGDLGMLPLKAQEAQNNINEFPVKMAKLQQDMRLATDKPIAEEVSKRGEDVTRVGQMRGMFDQLKSAVEANKPGLLSDFSGKAYNATGGRFGNAQAASIQNLQAPMTAALNYELTKRFNDEEAKFLQASLMPNPKDTPEFAKQKLNRLNDMISALESGNEQNIRNVASVIKSGTTSAGPLTTKTPPSRTGAPRSFGSVADAESANLPKGTIVIINGRRARID